MAIGKRHSGTGILLFASSFFTYRGLVKKITVKAMTSPTTIPK